MWLFLERSLFCLLSTIIVVTRTSNLNVNPTPATSGWEVRAFTGLYTGPYFDTSTPTNITSQLGTHTFLPCKIKQLGNKSVSWIRQRDSHILTVDRYTFIADERFQVLHNGEDWTLQIKFAQERDAGVYECQVTSEPKLSQFIHMTVVVPQTEILGEPDVFVKSGSAVQIKCVITQNLEQPAYIFWYHDQQRVNLVDGSKYSWVDRVNSNTTIGTLVIKSTTPRDSGNYTCSPSNIESASVMLHVLNGEHPAAMQQGSSGPRLLPSGLFWALSLCSSTSILISLPFLLDWLLSSLRSWKWSRPHLRRQQSQPPNYSLETSSSSFTSSNHDRINNGSIIIAVSFVVVLLISILIVLCGWRGGGQVSNQIPKPSHSHSHTYYRLMCAYAEER